MKSQLNTPRLTLRSPIEGDAKALMEYYARNKNFFKPWVPFFPPNFFSVEFQKLKIESDRQLLKKGVKISSLLFLKGNHQQSNIIGDISCSNIVRGVFQSGHLGYKMDKDHCRKGLMTEALSRFITYLFEVEKLHRLEANVIPENTASTKLLLKLGFMLEGHSKEYLKIDGKWSDHNRYALINQNFPD